MAHPHRQLVASVGLLFAVAWGIAAWLGLGSGTAGALGTGLVWHQVGSVVAAATLTIYLFLTVNRSRDQ